ncbi:MAG TPA: pyridoxal phosphate-dependent aminotransferase [Fibrobacteria bacterium]|nr:pyridoxal phosphate-dependent aminotransferase [Fibrobacteria bacterium]
MKSLAARTGRISTSQTVAIDAKYKRLKAEGKDVLSLGAGEPDLDTPDHAKLAAIESIRAGRTKYSQVTGLPELKEAVSRKFARDNGLAYPPPDIVISGGAKHCVFNALLALVEEGDEVLIPTPCWVTYPELVRFLGGTPVPLPTDMASGFKLAARDLEKAVTPRSKLLILNSPGNPTGAVYAEAELRALAAVAVKHDLYCLSDEIYEYIVYDGHRHVSIASLGPDIFARTVTINGMSKAYAMTGWRIGYTGAPPALSAAIGAIQSHGTHHPANASQYAALAALQADGTFPETMRAHLAECRALALRRLAGIPGLQVFPPQGAFYAFFNLEAYFGKTHRGKAMATSMDICEYFLEAQLLATVPGSSFGQEGFMRISFANGLETLDAALDRLEKGFKALLPA